MRTTTPIARTFALALGILALSAGTASAAGEIRTAGDESPYLSERLSDEFSITRWANPNSTAKIRKAPKQGARSVGKLHYRTEDGLPEVYIILRSHRDEGADQAWLQIRVPGRPNGRTGWVREQDLNALEVVRTHLRINRKTLTATLFKKGKKVFSSRIGVGKSSTPTPSGRFWIRERLKNLGGSGVYGPYAFGTAAYSRLSDWPGGGVVGIHGTNQPNLIPGRPSHGCIRLPNSKIRRLAKIMPIGTPVQIV
jgi:hypothetical protein